MTALLTAVISAAASITVGLLTLMGVVITNGKANRDIEQKIAVAQAVTDTKLAELTREVREHNKLAIRMPVVEEQMKAVYHRIEDIENIIN